MENQLYMIARRVLGNNDKEIYFRSGNKCFVTDVDGNDYIDFILAYGPVILGHNNSEYLNNMREKISAGFCFPSYSVYHQEYSEDINSFYKTSKTIGFFSTSSESGQAALRICRHITGKKKFVRLGYLGWHDNLINGGLHWHEPLNSDLRKKVSTELTYHNNDDYDAINWGDGSLETLQYIIANNREISCLMFDAYQSIHLGFEKTTAAIDLCRKNNILVVMDETKTSGRISPYGYYERMFDFDFTILGKAIGNGAATSVLIGKDTFDINYYDLKIGGTYARDNIGIISALITKEIMHKYDYYNSIKSIGVEVSRVINKVLDKYNIGHLLWVEAMMEGGILEFRFCDGIANQITARRYLELSLLNNNILVPWGHCFYVCSEHISVYKVLEERLEMAIKEWIHQHENLISKASQEEMIYGGRM
ncbi:aminotransferase class III-fold pyridoxal phosphate-dependent enzyme [Paenibacillus lautus]|uniref:aminotransferase class III-fold pyridoxal phosphate-dependent enzyme n=1 Tax=Paenibacillus lautus TaxID=1401 RepID=UPI003D2A90FA